MYSMYCVLVVLRRLNCTLSPQSTYCKRAILFLSSSKILTPHPPLRPASLSSPCNKGGGTTEIDTLEYQQTEKIETELKDVDRIRATNRCTQLCPGSPSGASYSHNTIYYSFPADSPPSRKEAPRWRVLYRITRQLLHRARCGCFSQKIETAS